MIMNLPDMVYSLLPIRTANDCLFQIQINKFKDRNIATAYEGMKC